MSPSDPASALDAWLSRLETFSPREIELGLERVSAVLERLAPVLPARTVTVAGTNGKGSCVAMLEALARTRGERVGCYTSPHLVAYNERIRIDGRAADDGSIVASFEAVEAVREGVPLTYFEYGTLAALALFAESELDTLVLEVGLGGRLDAVNAVDAAACLITNVGLDHCDWLGPDVETIAAEKAGVMRRGRPAVFGAASVPDAIHSAAAATGADLVIPGRDYRVTPTPQGWCWEGRRLRREGLVTPSLPGAHQLANAGAALALAEALDELPSRPAINGAFGSLSLAGRMQRASALGRQWLLDVAHNPDAARALAGPARDLAGTGRVIAVAGILADKDAAGIVAALSPAVDRWVICAPVGSRALPADRLAALVTAAGGDVAAVAATPADAVDAARALASAADLVLVTGSFMTVGPAMQRLGLGGKNATAS